MIQKFLRNVLDHHLPHGNLIHMLTATLVGAGTGLAAVFFIRLIVFIQLIAFTKAEFFSSLLGYGTFIFVPVIGGLVVGAPLSLSGQLKPKDMAFPKLCRPLFYAVAASGPGLFWQKSWPRQSVLALAARQAVKVRLFRWDQPWVPWPGNCFICQMSR
jgi:hypothetical protein